MMKKLTTLISTIFILFFLNISIYAQDVRLLKTKLADILMQMPAKNAEQLHGLLTQTLALGDEGLQNMLLMLKDTGKGDDVAVRFMLTSLCRYASEKGHETEWNFLQTNFLKTILANQNKEIQAYLIHQLNYGANDGTVEPLKKYLVDQRLCEPVSQLFLSFRGAKAEKAFLEALPLAADLNQITIAKALGEMESKAALPSLMKLKGSTSKTLQRVVLSAIANIGQPESYTVLWNVATKVAFQYEPTNAMAAFLKFTAKLGQNNELKLCKKACLAIIKNSEQKTLLHNQAAALAIYSQYFKADAMPLLLKAVDNPDSSFRMAALNLAKNLGDAAYTAKWLAKAEKISPNIQADILYMLGERADKSAVSYVSTKLQDKSENVRWAAVWALVKLDEQVAFTELLKHLSAGNDVAETEKALSTITDEKRLDLVAKALNTATNMGKISLINLIAAKSGKRFVAEVLAYTSHQDTSLKSSAISALKSTATTNEMGTLLTLLAQNNNPTDIAQLQAAIENVIKDAGNAESAVAPILDAMEKSNQKEKYISMFPSIGGRKTLATIANLFEKSEGALKEACFDALVNWNNADASTYLLTIYQVGKQEFKEKAFKGYLNQIKKSNWKDDQKLQKFQMLMPYTQTIIEKNMILASMAKVKTFLSLIYVAKYLDDADLQQTAAYSAAQIAMPETGKTNGFTGDITKAILQKTISIIKGSESEYIKENIKKHLETMPTDAGFVSMFNGIDLKGWKGYITDPIKLAALNAKELAKRQALANEKMLLNWSVKDGSIVFNGEGNNLLSDKEYGDFEMLVSWKISKKGDSGIYLRGSPQVQIWDTSRVEVGAQVGSGGLYNNQKNASKPLKVADNPINEWNTFHIFMIGERATVYLNGELVVDNTILENYWDKNVPIFSKGTIELQAHGTDLAFKDIYVREIKSSETMLTPQEKLEGFESLFNGKNLDGWVGNKVDYQALEGNIVIQPASGGGGNLYTEKEYADFNFRFEFKLTSGANNGLGIRAPLEGDAAYVGMELQILDNEAPIYAELKAYQYHGSVYGVIPAKRGFLKPTGEWNSEEVIVKGKNVKVILNSTTIMEGNIAEASKNGTIDHNQHPGLLRDKGHIGWLGHGSVVWFRNIRVKEL